jgi:primase-polymerase (primpol)-like protein
VTGDRLSEAATTVARRPDALAAIHEEYVQSDTAVEPEESPAPATDTRSRTAEFVDHDGNDLADDELLTKAKAAANGSKFARLYRGSTTGYPSQSEADMALCTLLAFWTGGDATQMDRLFRDSGLMRDKWDEVHYADGATYGERTIERAIATTDEFYNGDGGWRLFDDTPAAADLASPTAPAGNDASHSDEDMVPADVVATLRERLADLEAENNRLREELSTERERRGTVETADTAGDTDGLFSRLLSR